MSNIGQAAVDVINERHRQIHTEGWDAKHDDQHDDNSLVMAAIAYAAPVEIKAKGRVPCGCRSAGCDHWEGRVDAWLDPWPWDGKPKRKSRRFDLVRAAALIIAEIERLDRADIPTRESE